YYDANEREKAAEAYRAAREQFAEILKAGEKGQRIPPLLALLDLGIAQVSVGDRTHVLEDKEMVATNMKAAESAAATLEQYVRGDEGRDDPFGHFYLGIAVYRISVFDLARRSESLAQARDHLRRARELAHAQGGADAALVEPKVMFYEGLIEVELGNRQTGRSRLSDVVSSLPS